MVGDSLQRANLNFDRIFTVFTILMKWTIWTSQMSISSMTRVMDDMDIWDVQIVHFIKIVKTVKILSKLRFALCKLSPTMTNHQGSQKSLISIDFSGILWDSRNHMFP